MTNLGIQVAATADTKQAVASWAKYEAAIAAANQQLMENISLSKATDAAGFANLSKQANLASNTFRNAAASTGMFEVQQLRLNSATDDYIKKLKAQKMSFREMSKQRKVALAARKEQLALENMSVRENVGSRRANKGVYDAIVPRDAAAQLDTAGKRLAFMNAELKSGAHQMVNWGKNTQWAGRQLMVGFTLPIAAFGAAAGVMAYQVDKELTRVMKVIDTVATDSIGREKELKQVREDSLKTATTAAKEYGAAVTDTLDVVGQLAATGLMGDKLQSSSKEVMRIARLGEVDTQVAVDATISLQSVFRDTIKTSEDLTNAFNYMNSIENATSLTTDDFATAIPVAASAVKAFGGDVKEMGILLTAMRENGIGASEGANALKSTMQRLGRPSKQVREEWEALTGTNIVDLVDQSDGLMEVFQNINEATKDLDDNSKRKAFAGLFGSYQVSKLMALTKGMDELQHGVGQVSKAYEIANSSTQSWAKTAEREISIYKNSVAGMFDTTYQTLKANLAEVGTPFVVVATQVLRGVNKILEAFNNLPDLAKWAIAGTVGITALAGVGLMLAGLMANLAGNVIKLGANLAGLATKYELVTREGKAQQLIADLAASSYLEEASAVEKLTAEINAMAAAQAEANKMMRDSAVAAKEAQIAAERLATVPRGPRLSPNAQRQRDEAASAAYYQQVKDQNYLTHGPVKPDGTRKSYYSLNGGLQSSNADIHNATMGNLQGEAMAMNAAMEAERAKSAKAAADATAHEAESARQLQEDEKKRAEDTAKRKKFAGQAAGFMAIESALMAATMVSSNETLDNYLQIAMAAGMVYPALSLVGPGLKTLAAKGGQFASALTSAAGTAITTAKGTTTAAQGATRAATAFSKMKVAGLALMGPMGWLVTTVSALGLVAYKLWKDNNERQQKMIDGQKELAKTAGDWGASLGIARREMKGINEMSIYGENKGTINDFQTDTQYFTDTDSGKKQVDAFKNLDTEAAKKASAMQQLINVQQQFNVDQGRATTMVAAMWAEANGVTADEALTKIREYSSELGNVATTGGNTEGMWKALSEAQADALDPSRFESFWTGGDEANKKALEYAEEQGKDVGATFAAAWRSANTPEQFATNMEQLGNLATAQWDGIIDGLVKDDNAKKVLEDFGITTGEQLSDTLANPALGQKLKDALGPANTVLLDQMVPGAQQWEKTIIGSAAAALGLKGTYETLSDLQKNVLLRAQGMDKQQRVAMVDAAKRGISSNLDAESRAAAENWAMISANAALAADGMKTGSDYTEAMNLWAAYVASGLEDTKSAASDLGGRLARAKVEAQGIAAALGSIGNISVDAIASGAQDAMKGLQGEIADAERDAQQATFDAQDKALSDRQEAASNALSARLDREGDALDAAWDGKREGLEKYWDARIEGVEKAIKAEEDAEEKRQKMFDAEIARINELADMANTNIDFNVALNSGNLDEAAKIANNAVAKEAQSVFEREREKGAEKSEKRVDSLNDRKDAMGDKKDAALQALDKRAEAAKAYFDNYRKMEEDSLQASQDAQKESLDKRQDLEKKNLDKLLETFLAYTPRNKKQLEKHMQDLGISMDNFGTQVLQPMSTTWGDYYRNAIRTGIINSALEAESSDAWTKLAEGAKDKMVKALGFGSISAFNHFIKTGELKAGVDADPSKTSSSTDNSADLTPQGLGSKTGPPNATKTVTRHAGGFVGGGNDSRKGVANTYSGLHPSEQLVRARKGEFVVNEHVAAKNGPMLEALNKGQSVGGAEGPGGLLFGMLAAATMKGINKNLVSKISEQRKAQSMAANTGKGGGGMGPVSGSYIEGKGGWNIPAPRGFSWTNTHDYSVPGGTPLYALSDGVVVDSKATTSGGSPGNGLYSTPYTSYGETIAIRDASGNTFRYGHLSPGQRYVTAGQQVKGGALIGKSGNTGNAWGSGGGYHVHFDVNGNENASGYLASRGIGLRKGAEYVKYDNTMANLHRGESVLTKNLTSKMHEGVERFANGDNSEYNVEVNIYDARNPDEVARKVMAAIDRKAARRPRTRRAGTS